MTTSSLIRDDRDHLIHPVVSWKGHERKGVTVLDSGQGAYLKDVQGRELLDGFSGLWCVNLGYGQQSIVRAAAEQMAKLPYATGYFHFSSEPTIRLAARLAELAPGRLNRVFFTLGGSDAVDSAVRVIRYYFNVTGRPAKKHMIALRLGYHGSTTIASGLTGLPSFHNHFDTPAPTQHHIAVPYPYRSETGSDSSTIIKASVAALKDKVGALGSENVAAFFCEPVQGSGGIIVPPHGWLAAMREACRELDVLFVADEVITGFGRTGPLFACQHEQVEPDMMTLAKGLTSAYAPMGAVMLSEEIYNAIADGTPMEQVVGHGFTYSGHPVSAAVGLEALRLYIDSEMIKAGEKIGAYFGKRLAELAGHELVGDIRARGLIAGVELVTNKKTKEKPRPVLKLSETIARLGYENNLLFRAFPDGVVGFAPPLCCSPDDIDLLIERFGKTLNDTLNVKEIRDALG